MTTPRRPANRILAALPALAALVLGGAAGAPGQPLPAESPVPVEKQAMLFDGPICGTQGPPVTYPSPCPPPGKPPLAPGICHPYPQPRPRPSCQQTTGCPDDCFTKIDTGPGIFPPSNPFAFETFPGTNFLPNVYTNMYDGAGNEIPNTLPSTPDVPYNLQDGDPVVSEINPTSPLDDLGQIFTTVPALVEQIETLRAALDDASRRRAFEEGEIAVDAGKVAALIDFGIAVIEGEPVANRAYSGFPLLHYTGPEKTGVVVPKLDGRGHVVGGNLDVHQVWYGQHIESDVTFVDLTPILYDGAGNRLKDADGKDLNVTWTVTYTVDVLNRGHDDFSPFVIYFDPFASGDVNKPKKAPHIGMDQTFFPMDDGTRTLFKIKMAPAIYQNFIYTWGWRNHPPRIQVIESATAPVDYGGKPHPECPDAYQGLTSPEIDRSVFCPPDEPNCTSVRCAGGSANLADGEPTPCERRKLFAIGRIGELSPAKRMWRALRGARGAAARHDYREVARIVREAAVPAFHDWEDRTTLPAGVAVDPEADLTLLYVNNTIYGQLTDGARVRWNVWQERPQVLRVTAYNGDTFPHGYNIADFGGNRGWENQFKSSVKVGGSGCWFTFGRAHWWVAAGGPNGYLCVPAEGSAAPGKHRFEVTFNYDPSRRLRFYQFDPFHHDVAIFSLH
jgi:hypothetical protein